MHGRERQLLDLLDGLDDEGRTVVTSVRQPASLRDALRVAVQLGMDPSPNEAAVRAVRERLETFAHGLALEAHYREHPELRPDLGDLAVAAAELDAHPLAEHPDLLRRAAHEVVEDKPDATSDDVVVYAAALRRAAVGA